MPVEDPHQPTDPLQPPPTESAALTEPTESAAATEPTELAPSTGPPARPGWRRAFTGRYRWWVRIGAILLVLLLALGVDVAVVASRISHVDVALPPSGDGTTYVVVGSDSRAELPPAADPNGFGTVIDVPGQRADVVLIVQVTADGRSTTLSVPRDLLVRNDSGGLGRLALTLNDGPQQLIDGLCRTLGVRTDHLVLVDFRGFTEVVDTLGGVTVTIPAPLRDRWSGLQLDRPGTQALTGEQALALVRSRHPEELRDGAWVAAQDGAGRRTAWAGVVFDALRQSAGRAWTNPVLLQRLAWVGAGVLTTDQHTGVFDLAALARATGSPIDLPAAPVPGSQFSVMVSPDTSRVLAQAGITPGCAPG